jgi:NAD(P)H dehydrogenase (quinone)
MVDALVAPVKIVVVYHSGYGHTSGIAEAVARGAAAISGASVELVTAEEAPGRWGTLDGADAIIMGAPTYMGSLSAPFKAFMDATSHLQYGEKRWAGKIAAGFTNGGSRGGDNQNSLVQPMMFAAQHQMHWVNLGLNYGNNRSYTNEDILNRDSYTLGMAARPTSIRAATSLRHPPTSALRSSLGAASPKSHRSFRRDGPCSTGQRCGGVSGGADNQDPERRGVAIPEGVGVPPGLVTA